MREVVEVKVFNTEHLARSGECGADGVRGIGEDSFVDLRHCIDAGGGLWRHVAPNIVAGFVAGMLHVADENFGKGRVVHMEAFECARFA
jgi:hypothetical protein